MVHGGLGSLVGVGLVELVAGRHGGGVHVTMVRVGHSSCMVHRLGLGSDHPARCTVVMVREVRDDWYGAGRLWNNWWGRVYVCLMSLWFFFLELCGLHMLLGLGRCGGCV